MVRPSLDALTKVLMVVLGIHLLAVVIPFLSLFSLFAYLLQEILLMFLFHLPPYLTNRAIELINQAFEVSAGSLQVFFVWIWNCKTKVQTKSTKPQFKLENFLPKVTFKLKTRRMRHIFHSNLQLSLWQHNRVERCSQHSACSWKLRLQRYWAAWNISLDMTKLSLTVNYSFSWRH